MLQTALARHIGIRVPVFSVGMSWLAGPELASAVSNAGGCGVVGLAGTTAAEASARIRKTRALTSKPFGVNIILARLSDGQVETCLDERVPLIVLFWGDPAPYVTLAHQRGIKVIVLVGSVSEAKAAAQAGVDAIIAQGVEAGGHVKGKTSLSILLPAVAEAVKPVPVIAAGGIADGRGLAAALHLGAQGVSVGTRFVCSEEAFAASSYKERIVRSEAEDTIHTQLFNVGWNAFHRVLRNRAVSEWEAKGCPGLGERPGEGTVIATAPRGDETAQLVKYAANSYPTLGLVGDIEDAVLYAGESCSLIKDIKPAAQIVQDFEEQAEAVMSSLSGYFGR